MGGRIPNLSFKRTSNKKLNNKNLLTNIKEKILRETWRCRWWYCCHPGPGLPAYVGCTPACSTVTSQSTFSKRQEYYSRYWVYSCLQYSHQSVNIQQSARILQQVLSGLLPAVQWPVSQYSARASTYTTVCVEFLPTCTMYSVVQSAFSIYLSIKIQQISTSMFSVLLPAVLYSQHFSVLLPAVLYCQHLAFICLSRSINSKYKLAWFCVLPTAVL